MNLTITPGKLAGEVRAIPSKSQAHRLLICAAFADGETELICPDTNRDIEATAQCLRALGADITRTAEGYRIRPVRELPEKAELPCRDSGSTLRFLLSVVGALGVEGTFVMEGRLPQRPLSPLWEELERMGCALDRPTPDTLRCRGQLRPGDYRMDGGVSSQFISGLLLAFPLLPGQSRLEITGRLESAPYVDLTQDAMSQFSVDSAGFVVTGQPYRSPGTLTVEGDWSNAAFFLAANALGSRVRVDGLRADSRQGDRAVQRLLRELEAGTPVIDAADIPDLVPILAVSAACLHGAEFTNIRRLRLKESDRVQAVADMLRALGGRTEAGENTLTVFGTGLTGGTVDAKNDHRIAMSAAIAAAACRKRVTILGVQCVEKSYPRFFEIYRQLWRAL